ncbi:hypothetical protein [Streptomyces sp. NPDC126499]|uniref:hypothetical protein n=1 Tax=Streptomyces sp. NPDC126499 TaxID=3155314 RepID=UPI0033313440
MLKKVTIAAGATFGAIALTVGTAGTAQAATSGTVSCSTPGASGNYQYNNYYGPDATVYIYFSLTDTASDGNSVRVRMLSKDVNGATTYYPWRANTGGYNTTSKWQTTASNSRGLFDIGIQVARINTNGSIRNICTSWS